LETTFLDKCIQNVIDYGLAGYDGVYFDKWILGFGLPANSTFSVFHYHFLELADNFIAVGNCIPVGIYVFTRPVVNWEGSISRKRQRQIKTRTKPGQRERENY
jgi:hypothetical protein